MSELVAAGDSDFAKASKLYGWLKSRIRYVGIEFGDSGVVPHAPDQTVARAYGDCKDQATLLVGLLRATGLPAHVALLRSGAREDVNRKLPAINVFDHAIVVVPTERPLWLDPTADHVRPGALPVGDQGRLALVAAPDTEGLVVTPRATPQTNTYRERRRVHLSRHGPARVVEHSEGKGFLDTELRDIFARPADTVQKNLREYAQQHYYTEQVGQLKHSEPEDLLTAFEVQLEAAQSKVGITDVLSASVEAREGVLMSWLPAVLTDSEEERKTTLVLPAPYQAELIWEVHPPPGYVPGKLPEAIELDLGPAGLVRRVTTGQDGSIQVHSTFTTGKARYSAQDVKAFREALWRFHQRNVPYVEFDHPAKKLRDAGDPRAAVALVRQ